MGQYLRPVLLSRRIWPVQPVSHWEAYTYHRLFFAFELSAALQVTLQSAHVVPPGGAEGVDLGVLHEVPERWWNRNHISTPSMIYNGHLKFYPSVSLRILLYGSRNLAYVACKMDYMCPL